MSALSKASSWFKKVARKAIAAIDGVAAMLEDVARSLRRLAAAVASVVFATKLLCGAA